MSSFKADIYNTPVFKLLDYTMLSLNNKHIVWVLNAYMIYHYILYL